MDYKEKPVFMNLHDWDKIQEVLDYYGKLKTNESKNMWRLIKTIDNNLGGKYPYNYTW